MCLSDCVERAVGEFEKMWYRVESVPFTFQEKYTPQEQRMRYLSLKNQVEDGFKLFSQDFCVQDITDEMVEKGILTASEFLNIDKEACRALMSKEYAQVTEDFVDQAKVLFPEMDSTSVFQALRNVWIMVSVQILLGKPVKLTPSIFAYSMLYPLTDNLLDDPKWKYSDKQKFNERFTQRLKGEKVISESIHEDRVHMMVEMIESEYPRVHFPKVYESLLLIQKGQIMSLMQQGAKSPFETPLMHITFLKGSTSVLADGYLVAGELNQEMETFLMGYGIFLQLADDLQDAAEDAKNKHMTLFSYSIKDRTTMTALTNRFCRFMSDILKSAPSTLNQEQFAVLRLIEKSCHYLVFDAIFAQRRCFDTVLLKSLDQSHILGFKYHTTLKKQIDSQVKRLKVKGPLDWSGLEGVSQIGQRLYVSKEQ